MHHWRLSHRLIGVGVIFLVLVGCSSPPKPIPPTATPATPTTTPLPVTTNPNCGTLVTLDDKGSELQFGITGISFDFKEFYFEGVVTGEHSLAEVSGGEVKEVIMGGKQVTLTQNNFSEGSIHTKEFGAIKILTTANLFSPCVLLIVTPEQIKMITEWLR